MPAGTPEDPNRKHASGDGDKTRPQRPTGVSDETESTPIAGADQPTRPMSPQGAAWPAWDDLTGRTISQYRIVARLGEGGMGVVYKAQDTRLNRTVALKFLSARFLADTKAKQRFLHEARAAAALDDPHICTVHEIHEAEGHAFIVMAFVEGRSLKDRIESGPLQIGEALDIAAQIGRGLSRAHRQGIVHRDIKPGNVLLTPQGQVKIVDFGLAKLATQTQLTRTGTTMGTVAYMSPEQAKAEEVDHRTDIWALGAVLYEMLTGELPFRGENEQTMIHAILKRHPKAVSGTRKGVSIGVERILDRALAKNPAKRYQEVDRMLEDLATELQAVDSAAEPGRLVGVQRLLRKRSVQYAVSTILVAAGLVVGITRYQARASVIDSVAVLPFANLSGDVEQEYFADGMTDALINELSQMHALTVISRTSVMRYKNTDKTLPEIARELNVDAVVEASAQRDGDQVRIMARLIRANPERQVWARTYARDASDVISLNGEVAQAIAGSIHLSLTPQEETRLTRVRKVDPEAHDAYLKGRYYLNQGLEEGFRKAIGYFEDALEKDPRFALAHCGLAEAYASMAGAGWGFITPSEGYTKAKAMALKALEIDQDLAEAHTMLGMVMSEFDWDFSGAVEEYKRTLELNPGSAMALILYAQLLNVLGRHDEAITLAEKAYEVDPLTPFIHANLAFRYLYAGLLDKAIDEAQEALSSEPNFWITHWGLGEMYEQKGMLDEAIAELQKAVDLSGRNAYPLSSLGHALGVAGRQSEALEVIAGFTEESKKTRVPPECIALVYLGLDDRDQVFLWLERAFEEHSSFMPNIVLPPFDSLSPDPRYDDLKRRVGIV